MHHTTNAIHCYTEAGFHPVHSSIFNDVSEFVVGRNLVPLFWENCCIELVMESHIHTRASYLHLIVSRFWALFLKRSLKWQKNYICCRFPASAALMNWGWISVTFLLIPSLHMRFSRFLLILRSIRHGSFFWYPETFGRGSLLHINHMLNLLFLAVSGHS